MPRSQGIGGIGTPERKNVKAKYRDKKVSS